MASIRRGNDVTRRRRDIKERTMNRFVALDADVGSRYDEDEDDIRLPINQRSKVERQLEGINRDIRGRNNRAGRQAGRSAGGRKEVVYKVTIRNNGKGDVDYIMQNLCEIIDNILPFNIAEDANKNVTFYVYTLEEADNIKTMSRRISHPSDPRNKFLIYHNQQPAPWEALDAKIKIAVRDVVKSRYNEATNSVDLSEFQASKIFVERDLRSLCSFTRNAVAIEAIRVVFDLFPDITGLSLKNNRLSMLNYVQSFIYACPKVIDLDLSGNQLDNVSELKKIRGWGIEHLFLENNPLCSDFSNASSYTSAVQDFLPRVTFLDGAVVSANPFKLKADINRRSGVLHPPVQACYFPDKGLRQRVEQLLLQFYELYDGKPSEKSRQLLVNAYDENAIFTHAIYTWYDRDHKGVRGDDSAFTQYIRSSHNLCQEDKWERYREKIIYKGSMAIAVALSQLPPTEHDKSSFLLEFLTVRQQILVFTLRGILRDGADVDNPTGALKFFSRTFTVVPRGDDKMAIVNDDLILTPITKERFEKYTEQSRKMVEIPEDPIPGPSRIMTSIPTISMNTLTVNNGPGPSGLQEELQRRQLGQIPSQQLMPQQIISQQPMSQQIMPQPIPQQPAVPQYDRNDPAIQQAMVDAFSQQSGMKVEWTRKCLEDSGWDFDAAGRNFNDQRANIPPEAFI